MDLECTPPFFNCRVEYGSSRKVSISHSNQKNNNFDQVTISSFSYYGIRMARHKIV